MQRKNIVAGECAPLIVRIATPEAVDATFGGNAECFAAPLRDERGMFQCAGKTFGFARDIAPLIAGQPNYDDARGDTQHDQHNQYFDQRERA